MITMGNVYRNLGLYPQAQPLLEQALETQRRQRGHDDPETLRLANDVGKLYNLQGRYEDAEALKLSHSVASVMEKLLDVKSSFQIIKNITEQ
jgi:tetratricopeptide (TPR) repeat protein